MKRMTQKEFKDRNGTRCPICKGNNTNTVNYGFLELDQYCHDCDSEYIEIHRMAGYKIVRKGRK
tara:strand:- start:362 stop:553 length:192 start_codon:yes stop_codon:yes gene_type:complete